MTINCNGQLIDLRFPRVMGILNLTPDSFYDGGVNEQKDVLLKNAASMLAEGATFLDIGGYSTRPNAEHVSEEDEIRRVIPAIGLILKNFPDALLSIDTFRSNVAEIAVDHGVQMINDISAGLLDDKMIPTVSKLKVPYIMMHMQGTPQNMMSKATYQDLLTEMIYYFSERIRVAKTYQIQDVIIDPGFGFSKTIEQNFEVLKKLELFQILDRPLLIGLSRKSMIYKSLMTSADKALNGTSILNANALSKGANILRVHDVREAMECIKLCSMLN